ncbi:hypothetical protein U9M48_012207 [Paspalum notatum var. saurae]|uniref:Bifunctional inhibitor/plant lipid transfer protein/seed storage helical domain-containing protein n=1 Tax=Paspalum notatum var. saurae TaxID=547442 RepID=A0AAQ3WIB5_PASNO
MASSSRLRPRLLLAAAVLLSALAAATASAGTSCVPGLAIPHDPLPSCRLYVAARACGGFGFGPLPALRRRCCGELEDVPAYCRCEALRVLMDGVVPPGGPGARPEGGLLDLPGCPREAQRRVAAGLTADDACGLATITGGTRCPWGFGHRADDTKAEN